MCAQYSLHAKTQGAEGELSKSNFSVAHSMPGLCSTNSSPLGLLELQFPMLGSVRICLDPLSLLQLKRVLQVETWPSGVGHLVCLSSLEILY